jgi:hypothetical protein
VLIALADCSAVPLLDSAQPTPPQYGTIVSDALPPTTDAARACSYEAPDQSIAEIPT